MRERTPYPYTPGSSASSADVMENIGRDREIVSREDEIRKAFAEYETVRERERVMSGKELAQSNLGKEIESVSGLIQNERAKLEQKTGALRAGIEGYRKIILGTEETLARRREIEEGNTKLGDARASDAVMNGKRAEALVLDAGSAELGRRIEQKRTELETRAREL